MTNKFLSLQNITRNLSKTKYMLYIYCHMYILKSYKYWLINDTNTASYKIYLQQYTITCLNQPPSNKIPPTSISRPNYLKNKKALGGKKALFSSIHKIISNIIFNTSDYNRNTTPKSACSSCSSLFTKTSVGKASTKLYKIVESIFSCIL